jgi:hypothetical protein
MVDMLRCDIFDIVQFLVTVDVHDILVVELVPFFR